MEEYSEIAEVFYELSNLEMKRSRFFPSRAFKSAGNAVQSAVSYEVLNYSVILHLKSGGEFKLGNSSTKIFLDFINTHTCQRLYDLRDELMLKKVDEELKYQITKISGIGEVKAIKILESNVYSNFEEFITRLPKVGEFIGDSGVRYTQMMHTGLEMLRLTSGERLPWDQANKLANGIIYSVLNKVNFNFYVHKLGSLRRHKDTVGDIDLVVSNCDEIHFDELRSLFSQELNHILVQGESKIAGIKNGFQVDIRFLPEKYLGAMILHGTGSAKMNILMRAHAKKLGCRLNEYGIFDPTGEFHTFSTEQEVFNYLGVEYVPPKFRSDISSLRFIKR